MKTLLLTLVLATGTLGAAELFNAASASAQKDYDRSQADLSSVRTEIDKEKEPLNRELGALEEKLRKLQDEYAPLTREVDQAELNLSNLKTQVKLSQDENTYLTNIMDEFTKGYESKIHVSEMQRVGDVLGKAKLASENDQASLKDRFMAQVGLIKAAIERLADVIGGFRFDGQAVDGQGFVMDGKFALLGPMAFFADKAGKVAGIAMPQVGSQMPIIRSITPEINLAISNLVATGSGSMPLDATLGGAIKDVDVEHILL